MSALKHLEHVDVRDRLDEERGRLLGLAGSLSQIGELPVEEPSGADQHPADQATETFERSKDSSIQHQVEAQLADLERARARLDDGTYGSCEACGEPIGQERLIARPTARFCVVDQQIAERASRVG